MAGREYDKWLAFGLGVFILVGVAGVSWQLGEALKLSKITSEEAERHAEQDAIREGRNPRKKPRKVATEDDISLSTLAILVNDPNYDIRQAATRIILRRFANSQECREAFQRDFKSSNEEDHDRAVKVLTTMDVHGVPIEVDDDEEDSQRKLAEIDDFLRVLEMPNDPTIRMEDGRVEISANGWSWLNRIMSWGSGSGQVASNETEQRPEELALRRWQRREAIVIENTEDGATELIEPL